MVKEFINHNVQLKNINKETTVEELLQFIDNVEQSYIPLILKVAELNNELCGRE
jgi:L-cysteine desulfidase